MVQAFRVPAAVAEKRKPIQSALCTHSPKKTFKMLWPKPNANKGVSAFLIGFKPNPLKF
jgi:hypothetical protein